MKGDGKQILEELKGKTRDEAEWLTASYNPVSSQSVKDKITKVVVGVAPTPQADMFAMKAEAVEFPTKSFCIRGGSNSEEKFKISFSAGADFMEKLNRAQELMFSGSSDDLLLENIFGEALELYVEKHCPKEKQKRRDAREAKKEFENVAELTSVIDNATEEVSDEKTASRYIPAAVRDKVLERDNYQCSYISYDGTRCGCRKDLEIDHVVPFALRGKTEIGNLRTLCSSHNLHAARQAFGQAFIERKIAGT